jgi:hypothetical protein
VIGLQRRVFNRRENILARKGRVIGQNLLEGRAGAEQLQNVHNPHSRAANARAPATLVRLDGDALQEFWLHSVDFNTGEWENTGPELRGSGPAC